MAVGKFSFKNADCLPQVGQRLLWVILDQQIGRVIIAFGEHGMVFAKNLRFDLDRLIVIGQGPLMINHLFRIDHPDVVISIGHL